MARIKIFFVVFPLFLSIQSFSLIQPAFAGADVQITWAQEWDCEYVHHWELYVDDAPLSDLEGVCGGAMIAVVTVPGVGPRKFKLRGKTADGILSPWSNEVIANVPFAAPALVGVEIR